jgi:hypothetical protein
LNDSDDRFIIVGATKPHNFTNSRRVTREIGAQDGRNHSV